MTTSDRDLETAFIAEMKVIAEDARTVTVTLSHLEAWILLTWLGVGLRHPTAPQNGTYRLGLALYQRLAGIAAPTPALREVARRGMDARYDQPRDQ